MSDHPAEHGYWRSLAELANSAEFRAQLSEPFPEAGRPYITTEAAGDLDRRRWMQVIAASAALASAVGCRWQREEIVPLAKRPEHRVPGEKYQVATTMDIAGDPIGLLVTCVDGRPIKVEGNPLHPSSNGATHLFAQAATLELYDPDRSRYVVERTEHGDEVRTWDLAEETLRARFDKLKDVEGEGLVVVSGASSSPTLAWLRSRLRAALPRMRWLEHEPCGPYAQAAAYYDFTEADVIVAVGADVFGPSRGAVRLAGQFARRRDPALGEMNRLYVIESALTITGAAADHRLAIRPERLAAFLSLLSKAIDRSNETSVHGSARHSSDDEGFSRAVELIATDLLAHRGRCVVVGPDDPDLLPLAAAINQRLGVIGKTVQYYPAVSDDVQRFNDADWDAPVDTLVILGGNPAYDAPGDLEFADVIRQAGISFHLSLYRNETSRLCSWHLPEAHFLEAWSDACTLDGVYSVAQPTIDPLYQGRTSAELLAAALGLEQRSSRQLVRSQFVRLFGEDDWERRWRKTLHDGVFLDQRKPLRPAVSLAALAGENTQAASRSDSTAAGEKDRLPNGDRSISVVFAPSHAVYDGRYANNAWLQEFPDPITRLAWGNAAALSPNTASALGVTDGDIVRLSVKGREIEAPVCVVPGTAEWVVALPLGYGRTEAGRVGGGEAAGSPTVGVNAYRLRGSDSAWLLGDVSISKTERRDRMACVQDHFPIDSVGFKARLGRAPLLVREADLTEYRKHPDFAQHVVHVPHQQSLWCEPDYHSYRWAMTIDLSKCIGCGACVVACQAENNIPVVGREQVLRGREMHWLRIDRYFSGPPDRPRVAFQPIPCQQCELAPCEGVCPVNATVHSSEGLNDMVYNRCVGTRYCGNNCPYKVRRFNYFNYQRHYRDAQNEVLKMGTNPEVTVRSRGVMEKCTYCIQRIQAAKIQAKNAGRAVRDGEIQTACQQACPAGAITFGDLGPAGAEPRSAVAKRFAEPRAYELLGELNHKARTRYLARIRNPHPKWELG